MSPANLERGLPGPIGDVNVTLPLVIDVDVATLLQAQLGEILGIGENATIFEICAAIDAQQGSLDITAVIDALELDLDPIVTAQISQVVNQIAIAINEITGEPIDQALIDEILAGIDIDAYSCSNNCKRTSVSRNTWNMSRSTSSTSTTKS